MESQLEKEARFRQLMAHSSHDSAIDTDSMEWETEVVEFERETVSCRPGFPSALLTGRPHGGGEGGLHAASPSFTATGLEVGLFLLGCDASFPCTCPSWVVTGWSVTWWILAQCVEGRGKSRGPRGNAGAAVCLPWLRGADCILGTEGPVSHEEGTVPHCREWLGV